MYVLHGDLCRLLCLLHISRSDAPIGLRCSRRQMGTKPSDVTSGPHSHWPNGAQCVHSRRLVPGSRTILYDSLVGTVKESYLLHSQLRCTRSAPDRPTTSRWSPDEADSRFRVGNPFTLAEPTASGHNRASDRLM